MGYLVLILLLATAILVLAFFRISLVFSVIVANLISLYWLLSTPLTILRFLTFVLLLAVSFFVAHSGLRTKHISSKLLKTAQKLIPNISATEQEALDAGTVWWDAELWSGSPNWKSMLNMDEVKLTSEEILFLDGPVHELCNKLDDWDITHNRNDLPEDVWQFIKDESFFGIIVPKAYGGLGFSATAHSAIIAKLASRSITAAVTVMVPNSLGPAELLQHYGTEAQKSHYLPKLASGEEVPCFGLTNPNAGSDASAIPDNGIICKDVFDGEETIGIRVNWQKRYITMGPIASLIGVAFKLFDPEHLIGDKEDLGITFALIPSELKGVCTGNRHFPLNCPFMVGPNEGKDVFIPINMVIGEEAGLGKGWSMLMEALAAGRGVSLPALSTGGTQLVARAVGAYAAARKQFNLPIGRFEGVQEQLAIIAGFTYMMNGAKNLTLSAIDSGEKPAVVTGIVKYNLTEMMRTAINSGMDIQGGAGICLGPRNLLGRMYQSAPIGITVEGANILTRSFIVFNQSLLRCHPYYYKEIKAAATGNLKAFDRALFSHMGFLIQNSVRSLLLSLGFSQLQIVPSDKSTKAYLRQLTRLSSSFAFVADVSAILLGGALKRKEMLTGRLADSLSHLFIAASVIKNFHNENCPKEDLPLLHWSCQYSLHKISHSLEQAIENMPNRFIAVLLKNLTFPFGNQFRPPSDRLSSKVAELLLHAGEARNRLTRDVFIPDDSNETLARLEAILPLLQEGNELEKKLRENFKKGVLQQSNDYQAAVDNNIITQEQAELMETIERTRDEIVAVDDFSSL